MEKGLIDDIINRLLCHRGRPGNCIPLWECEIRRLCLVSSKIFLEQPALLELEAPIKICGDVHGQFSDLLRLFDVGGYPPCVDYLFLGDYVDRGEQGVETMCLLLAYKIKYPKNFFLLRGNHECKSMNIKYGFADECKRKFNAELWETFVECFNCLPVAAIVGEKIFCVHGGISPDLHNLDQIRKIPRPAKIPNSGLLCDLLWSDPSDDIQGWQKNKKRNISVIFGPDKVTAFLQKHDLELICRAHSVVKDGYQLLANGQLLTIFSACGYRGGKNCGAILSVSQNLVCRFQILEPSCSGSTTTPSTPSPTRFPDGDGDSSSDEVDILKIEVEVDVGIAEKVLGLAKKLELLVWERTR